MALATLIAAVMVVLSSRLVPRVLSALTAPICRMKRGSGGAQEGTQGLLKQMVHLYGIYLMGGFLFAITGGAVGLLAVKGMPSEVLLFGGAGGLIVVTIARVEAIAHSTSLADYLQCLFISAASVATFIIIARGTALTALSDMAKANLPDFILLLMVGSLFALSIAEIGSYFLFTYGDAKLRLVPFSLVRQRIEQWEMVDQMWAPWKVLEKTRQRIRDTIREEGPLKVCWLTNTHPGSVLDELVAGTRAWSVLHGKHIGNAADYIAERLQIVIPSCAESRFKREVSTASPFLGSVHLLRSEGASSRVRLLILNSSVAIVHLPIQHDGSDLDESSNYAAFITDPARIYEMKAWFDEIWRDSKAL
jgi:hypothetical protein